MCIFILTHNTNQANGLHRIVDEVGVVNVCRVTAELFDEGRALAHPLVPQLDRFLADELVVAVLHLVVQLVKGFQQRTRGRNAWHGVSVGPHDLGIGEHLHELLQEEQVERALQHPPLVGRGHKLVSQQLQNLKNKNKIKY